MHHLPHIFSDTLRPERPDCPVLIPSSFSAARDRVISQDIYSYEPCGLPTGNFMPAESAQIRLMTASPVTLRACIPTPDQITPEQAYFYKKTLFHTPFLSRGRAVTLIEYRDAKIVFEVDDWFSMLPQAVQRYLLPLQSKYAKWYEENVRKAVRYQPVTEELTPPVTPPRTYAVEQNVVQDTPSPVQKPGRSRGRGTWPLRKSQ